jgi:uncharacterized RDD family membrane protein YckC
VQYEDKLTISTPEGIDVELTLAGVGSRFAARLLDELIRGAALLVILLVLGFPVGALIGSLSDRGSSVLAAVVSIVVGLFAFALLFGYDVFFEVYASGRSPGKRATGLRVVQSAGEPVGFRASVIRNLIRLVDFLPTAYAVGAISILVTPRNQRLGDLAAGTLVVRETKAAATGLTYHTPAFADASLATWDVSAVDQDDLSAVNGFLDRRVTLAPEARSRLAHDLESALRPKVAGAPTGMHPEIFLEKLAAAKAARL